LHSEIDGSIKVAHWQAIVMTMANIQAPINHLNSNQTAHDNLYCSVKGKYTVTTYLTTAPLRLRKA
jgi:hypothetical protein